MAHHHKLRAEAGRCTANVGKPNNPTPTAAEVDAYRISTIMTSPIEVTDRELEGREIDRLLRLARLPKARGPPE